MNFIKHFLLNLSAGIGVKSISLLLTPLSLACISPAEYGLYALCNSGITVGAVILSGGLRQVFWLEFFHKPGLGRRYMLNDLLVTYGGLVLLWSAVLVLLGPWLGTFWRALAISWPLLVLCTLLCILTFFVELIYQIFAYRKQSGVLLAVQLASSLTQLIVTVPLLFAGYGVWGLLVAQLVGQLVVVSYGGFLYWTANLAATLHIGRAVQEGRNYLWKGAPFIPSLLAVWGMSSGVRWLLAVRGDLTIVGLYSLAETVTTLFQLVLIKPLQNSYVPAFFEKLASAHEDHKAVVTAHWRLLRVVAVLLGGGSLFSYCVVSPWLQAYVPTTYHAVLPAACGLAVSNSALVVAQLAGCLMQFLQKTMVITGLLIGSVCLHALLALLLIPAYGLTGAVAAMSVASLVYCATVIGYNYVLERRFFAERGAGVVRGLHVQAPQDR